MNDPLNDKLKELQHELSQLDLEDWLTNDLFSKEWWIVVVIFIVPWVVFFRLLKKERLPELILFAALTVIMVETLDHLGYELGLWFYPVEMLPLFPRFEEVNLSGLPVAYTLIYQYYSDWRRYFFVLVIMSALFTGVAEPALVALDLYEPLKWKPLYGFPVYIAIGLIVKWFVAILYSIADKAKRVS